VTMTGDVLRSEIKFYDELVYRHFNKFIPHFDEEAYMKQT